MNNERDNESIESRGPFLKEVAESGPADLVVDISEIGLDKLLESTQSELIGQIPIVKKFYAIAKAGYAIHDFFFKKKLIRFLGGFKDADAYLREKLEEALSNTHAKQEMCEHLIIALQRFDQIKKADALCNYFLRESMVRSRIESFSG